MYSRDQKTTSRLDKADILKDWLNYLMVENEPTGFEDVELDETKAGSVSKKVKKNGNPI